MKLYIATLINHNEYGINAKTFVDTSVVDLAVNVCKVLDEEDLPFDPDDILIECKNGNQHGAGEPLSVGVDTDYCREFLLTTKVTEI